MTRIVIHAGFHKTGTTSVQSLIRTNKRLLERQIRCYLKPDFEALTEFARLFSVAPSERSLTDLREAADLFFLSIDPEDPRDILMSSEDLSGHLPGRRGLDRYDAASLIMVQLAEAARARFGAQVDLVFYFSTRGRDAWLRSTYWQNLRVTRLVLDYDSYAAQIAAAADLDEVLVEVAEAVAPHEVSALPLEESTDLPQGPLTPLLDLTDFSEVTRAKLHLLPPENVQPDLGLEPVFLALNRSGLKDRYVSEAKKQLRQFANRQMEQG